jgi:flagellar hook-length control protein FliK
MNAIISSSLSANTVKTSLANSCADSTTASFNSALLTQIQEQGQKASVSTIDSNTTNSVSKPLNTTKKASENLSSNRYTGSFNSALQEQGQKPLSNVTNIVKASIKKDTQASVETTDSTTNNPASTAQPQDLLTMMMSILDNTTRTQQTLSVSDTASAISAAINTEVSILAQKSADLSTVSPSDNTLLVATNDISSVPVINNPDPSLTAAPALPAISTSSMQATIPTYPITPSLSQSGWDDAVSQRVTWMVNQNIQSATLTINPEHLGPIQIQIQMENQQANVQFSSTQAEVRLALQNSIPMLSQMLEQTGIQLGQSDVNSQSFGANQQQPQQPHPISLLNDPLTLEPTNSALTSLRINSSGNGLLNIYA